MKQLFTFQEFYQRSLAKGSYPNAAKVLINELPKGECGFSYMIGCASPQ